MHSRQSAGDNCGASICELSVITYTDNKDSQFPLITEKSLLHYLQSKIVGTPTSPVTILSLHIKYFPIL